MNSFLWALTFLTIIPVGRKNRSPQPCSTHTMHWFPPVGLCIGILLSMVYLSLYFLFPVLITNALIILIYTCITGGMHLDGLADTCDGIWGGSDRDRRLEIMKDSQTGSFGVISLIFLLGLKYLGLLSAGEMGHIPPSPFSAATKTFFGNISPTLLNTCSALVIMPVTGRWAQVLAAGQSRYARGEQGTGSLIIEGTTYMHIITSTTFTCSLLWFFYNMKGFLILSVLGVQSLLWIRYINRKIGGMTGDTLGATNELTEALFLLCLLAGRF